MDASNEGALRPAQNGRGDVLPAESRARANPAVTASGRFHQDHVRPNKRKTRTKSRPRAVEGLTNARLVAFEFPETFKLPAYAQIKKLKPGDFVKLERNCERFWVRIDGFVGRKWHGTVDSKLGLNDDLSAGDSIYFMRKHIYDLERGR